ncbi:hypothetical protein FRC18_004789 [Serendipita sp. 400]|nr:hypothetical protein FRC18_004789 [Serendipita sp. 400]
MPPLRCCSVPPPPPPPPSRRPLFVVVPVIATGLPVVIVVVGPLGRWGTWVMGIDSVSIPASSSAALSKVFSYRSCSMRARHSSQRLVATSASASVSFTNAACDSRCLT